MPVTEARPQYVETLKEHLWGSRRWILLFALITTAWVALHHYYHPYRYSASVVMLVREDNPDPERDERTMPTKASRLYYMATSTGMFEHLIDRFDLCTHFGIDTLDPYASDRIMDRLADNVAASEPGDECLMVTVLDEDRKMASDLANAIFSELQRMTEQMAQAQMRQTVAIYNEVVKDTEAGLNERVDRLYDLYAAMRGSATPKGLTEQDHHAVSLELGQMVTELNTMNQDLIKAQRVQGITLALLKADRIPEVQLVQRAREDLHGSPVLKTGGAIALTALLSLLGGCLISAIWFMRRGEFRDFLLSTEATR